MTESEWLACDNVFVMLSWARRRLSARKLRLWGCACCRHVWPLLTDPRSRRAVEVAECFADGEADDAELAAAREDASRAAVSFDGDYANYPSRSARELACREHEAGFAAVCAALLVPGSDELIFHLTKAVSAEAARCEWDRAEALGVAAAAARGTPGAKALRAKASHAMARARADMPATRSAAAALEMAYQRSILRDLLGPFGDGTAAATPPSHAAEPAARLAGAI
jgi:hypothetical protein